MKTLALSLAGALAGTLAFGAMATAIHAEPSWSDKDRRELYRVQRQSAYESRYARDYYAPRVEYYGYYDEPYGERYYRPRPRYYRW